MVSLSYARGERVFLLDSDLEEEPEDLSRFHERFVGGHRDVVYIPKEERDHVFQHFYRGAHRRRRARGSVLPLHRRPAAGLSGKITLNTPQNGQCLLVEIDLPRTHAVAGT
jgi:hypothetical protein